MIKLILFILCILSLNCAIKAQKTNYLDNDYFIINPHEQKVYHSEKENQPLFLKQSGDNVYYVDSLGNIIIDLQYDYLFKINENRFVSLKKDKFGIIDSSFHKITECIYSNIGYLSEGLLICSLGDKFGYIDLDGNTIINHEYQKAEIFSEGLAAVKKKGLYGYIKIMKSFHLFMMKLTLL